jgi:hypothetical protein
VEDVIARITGADDRGAEGKKRSRIIDGKDKP